MKKFIRYKDNKVPRIEGAGGGGKGGGKIAPNSLFSTDILYVTVALGEGPVYRINPNGPQDIQIQDSSIDDLINLDSNGLEDTDKFLTITTTGTITQDPLPKFGDEIVTPQVFASQINLKFGNIKGIPRSEIISQETSANDWDALRFVFIIDELYIADDKGGVKPGSLTYRITIFDRLGISTIASVTKTVSEKTDSSYKFSETINIPAQYRSPEGYRFAIEKISIDHDDPKYRDTIKVVGWDELKYIPQAYPRTALVGYALKAMNEHTGGVPNFTSLVKGLLVKVPANYNQPILASGEIDWRELETGESRYTTLGYRLQRPGTGSVLTAANPVIYTGTWDGTFVYSWTQNPVWIIYDILTNTTYGLGIPEENIDKYKFYQVAQYCDACDSTTGAFTGVSAVADGSFRYKPRTLFSSIRENQIGLPKGSIVSERRFITDVTISDQENAMDILNKLTATFRSILVYAAGKISFAIDMPDEYPVMLFNETNIKQGSFQISGVKESEVYTGVDITYVEPTNHHKREVIRLDLAEANDGREIQAVENIASLDLTGVTRRSQAIRLGQYQIASSRYLKRNISFTTSTEALSLSPGDVISVAMNGTGIAYGYGGKVSANSSIANAEVQLEHYTVPSLSNSVFTANTYPIALRIIKADSDRMDLYLVSNTDFSFGVNPGWDISTATYSQQFSVAAQDTAPLDIFFKPDGTKMYILGNSGDDVNEYDLDIAWDISTASFVQLFSVVAEEATPQGIFFKPDGTKMYTIGSEVDEVNEYDLSVAWDISTATFVQLFSVTVEEANPTGIFFKPDGYKMYIIGSTGDEVNEYDLSVAWDISTATFSQLFSVANQETVPTGIFFKPDGTKMYIIGSTSDTVSEYNLSVAWDISTATFVQLINVADQETGPQGIFFKPDGTKMYIVGTSDDEVNEYSLTTFSASENVSTGLDLATLRVISRFDPITRNIVPIGSGFTANNVPVAGDLWTLGEFENPNNYYTNKSGKLFKVTEITRDANESEVALTGIEYIPNVYIDSDTFINYEPTAYIDITSPFSVPPTPIFTFTAVPKTKLDGTVIVDGVLNNKTEFIGYGQKYETEYYLARPESTVAIANVLSYSPLTFSTEYALDTTEDTLNCSISGKNGFTTPAGDIRLLCNAISTSNVGLITLTLEGLSLCVDENFNQHVLEVNDGVTVPSLKGTDQITLPIVEKANVQGIINFVGYQADVTSITREIVNYNISTDTVTIQDSVAGIATLSSALLTPPFYVNINQILAKGYYANSSVYVQGTEINQLLEGELVDTSTVIALPTKPRSPSCVKFYVDGKIKTSGQYAVNINKDSALSANIQYTKSPSDSVYRVEICYYTVPSIEIGDRLEVNYGNSYSVINTSYDTSSVTYNTALTSNSIYRIQLDRAPELDLSGFSFINITQNPIGDFISTGSNTFVLSYNANTYPGIFNLANNGIYSLELDTPFEKQFLTDSLIIPELPLGVTTVRARNKNLLGRTSAYVTKSVFVEQLPIQKVENLLLEESMYREQTGGVSVRVTCSFDHIIGQEVTDYEISYKLNNVDSVGSDDGGSPLTAFNTVKIPATGVDTDNKIRFTINNINRGASIESNAIIVRVTPLNKSIRGITAIVEKPIIGKTSPPNNIIGFTGGQQNDVITFFWNYARSQGDLLDLDLKEVVINRVPGEVAITLENFLAATPVVTVSTPSGRKSVPIDTYGTFTYLVRTRDTSGNLSETVVGATINTTRPQRATTVAAYNEDSPSVTFVTGLPNNNALEANFPSFANSNTGGIAYDYTSSVDNANGSSTGWSAIAGFPTDILADQGATYITQIRDFGQTVTGQVNIDIEGTQQIQSTYNDQHERVLSGVTEASSNANILIDVDFGGIGHVLGFANAQVTTGRYDANNRTWMTGPANGNVWAIWNHGQFNGDTANANSYAFIAGLINANAIALGNSYFANGVSTGSNSYFKITSFVQQFSIADQEATPQGIFFKPDGTKMYIVGSTGDDVNEYNLSAPWDISTASFLQLFSVAAQDTAPLDIFFKPDGTKMYILGNTGDDVNEYDLSTAWDISTASFLQLFSVATEEATPQGIFFKSDGTKMYIVGSTGDDVNEYDLSVAWDVSTASFLQLFSVAAQEANPTSIFFKSDGTKMYIVGSTGDDVNEYDLSVAWDVSTATFLRLFSVANQETVPTGIFFKPDGTKMYIIGSTSDTVSEYNLGTAWNLLSSSVGESYTLVNMLQYSDTGSATYVGTLGAVTTETYIRSTTNNPFYANGNVNTSVFSASGDGWIPYEVGTKTFRYFQIKYIVNNTRPDEFDFTLDKFRYIIDKEQTVFTDTVVFDSNPKTVDITSAVFLNRPVINYTILDQIDAEANPCIVITTAASNQSISFKLVASDGTGQYQANSSANIMITAIGV